MFQFPSSGICFLNLLGFRLSQILFTIGSVSIPFKRDMLSEPLRGHDLTPSIRKYWFQFPSSGICFLNNLKYFFKQVLTVSAFQFPSSGICFLKQEIRDKRIKNVITTVSIPFKRDMLSEQRDQGLSALSYHVILFQFPSSGICFLNLSVCCRFESLPQ